MSKIKLGILFGGTSNEKEVSVLSKKNVMEHLNESKYLINEIFIDADGSWIYELHLNKPDIVLNLLHGGNGENGGVQGLLECFNIPYIGSKILASSLAMNKKVSKEIFEMNKIPVVDGVFIEKQFPEDIINYESQFEDIGYPLVIKPNNGGSSIGVHIAENYEELDNAVKNIIALNDDILIEKYISGREVACGVVENKNGIEVLTVLDIGTTNKFYDYTAKYKDDNTKIEFSSLPDYLQDMIKGIARKSFLALNCEGFGRVDMIVDNEQVYVLEMNTLPGLTKTSLIPTGLALSDRSFSKFLDELIEFELKTEISHL